MRHAFSLVELSIVLVILGLLTGGVLTGQNLIRAAELRAVPAEFQAYQTAFMTFQDKYFALPGDMINATDFWGASANCPGTESQGTGNTSTCNGDGNGQIDNPTNSNEQFRAWQHLARAGLISGTYEGVLGSSGNIAHHIGGFNAPASKLSNGVWATRHRDETGDGNFFDYDYNNTLQIGAQHTAGTPFPPIFTPEEAWGVDTKIDDGIPSRGKVIGIHWNDECSTAVTGATASNNYDAEYFLNNSDVACALVFKDVF